MKIEVLESGILSKYEIELEKHEEIINYKIYKEEINKKIKEIDNKYKEIKEEIENIKIKYNENNNEENKNNLILEIKKELNIKEILEEKDIKDKLFKEFEERISKIYIKKENINNIINEKVEESINKLINKNINNNVDEKIFNNNIENIKIDINKQIEEIKNIKNIIKSKEYKNKEIEEYTNNKINQNIKNIQYLSYQINKLNEKNKDNFIILKIKINKDDIGKDIKIINQCNAYKFYKNFEPDDIEVLINEESIQLKYKRDFYNSDRSYTAYEKIPDINYESSNDYEFYWNFLKEGIYTIKIIFKKQLISCQNLFYNCSNIIEIDISKFDSTKLLSCNSMFAYCYSLLNIDFGNLDFSLVKDFSCMFYNCSELVNLDVSNFNTKNSKSFDCMFCNCYKLKMIDVSHFNSSKCETIHGIFKNCYEINEIDMINWDMSNLEYNINNPIDSMFYNYGKLKKIKISGNLKKDEAINSFLGQIFINIPEKGQLILNKNIQCNIPLNGYLPHKWIRFRE